MDRRTFCQLTGLGLAAGITSVAWKNIGNQPPRGFTRIREPEGIMGTRCRLVIAAASVDQAEKALSSAEAAIRKVEIQMSSYLHDSDVGRINRAKAGTPIPISADTLSVLRKAHLLWQQSGGAFDITIGPLVQLWRLADRNGEMPEKSAIAQAREASSWRDLDLLDSEVVKSRDSACVDLGGIAKGFGVDQGIAAMQRSGATGGLVEIGGDLRSFGSPFDTSDWRVAIRDPNQPGPAVTLPLRDLALCTSGDYERGYSLSQKPLHHILHPESGYPVENARSLSVEGPDATGTDAWATAASVLSSKHEERLPSDYHILHRLPEVSAQAPSSPIASTGQLSIASCICSVSSSPSGCLLTKEYPSSC